MKKILLLLSLLCLTVPVVNATPTCNTSMSLDCYHININNSLAGVIAGGDVEIYVAYLKNVAESDSILHATIMIDAPSTTSPVFTYTTSSQTGCSISTPQTKVTSTAQYLDAVGAYNITMQDTSCSALIEVLFQGGAVATTIFDLYFPINIASNDAQQNMFQWTCDKTAGTSIAFNQTSTTCNQLSQSNALSGTISVAQSGTWTIDNTNRLCAASALGSACTTPLLNLTGTVAQTQSGVWQIDNQNRFCASSTLGSSCSTPSVNMDILDRLCNASAIGASCTTPTLNATLSGTIGVSQSGTWTIDNTNRLCAASALGTSCTTPTVNTPLTGTVAVSQSGTWQMDEHNRLCVASAFGAICSTPDVNVHQDQACGATIQCLNQLLNGNMTSNMQFNTTVTNTPSIFENLTGTTGTEIFFLVGLIIAAIFIWSRSQDFMIQMMMMFVLFIPGLIWLNLWTLHHWKGSIMLALLTFMLALYMGLRTGLDNFTERKAKRESR